MTARAPLTSAPDDPDAPPPAESGASADSSPPGSAAGAGAPSVSAASDQEAALRSLLEALRAIRDGDFRPRFTAPDGGTMAEIAEVLGQISDRNRHLADEVHRVCQQVNREGRLDERLAASPGQGRWTSTVEQVNTLLDLITTPLSGTARVLEAVAAGDLSQRAILEVGNRPLHGDLRRPGLAANRMIDQLTLFTSEVTRVARELGTEGRLGGHSKVRGLAGRWAQVTEAVNDMAGRLTYQVRDIAAVTTAVARGDLTRKVSVEATGEMLELKLTVNTMVDQLSAFADEVTRVAREVGTEGRLGGQAQVRGVSGTWKDLTESVNVMASNLTYQVRNIAQVATSVARGDLGQKITVDVKGELLELKDTMNTMVDQLSAFAGEVTRVAREVGSEGNLGGRAEVQGVSGVWKDLTDNVNSMANNLTSQVRNIAQITKAVADGDLSKKITVDAQGEILELKDTINTMVDQLSAFAGEVTRVAREVGTEGRLGGQAQVRGVSGVWKDLTDNVNSMANNLTSQVRNIAQITKAVADGDLSKKITVDAQGEILELKDTLNTMVDQLSGFADEVTRVAREVGTEGELGGQAQVRGVSGVWKDLTDNVNSMANNLTSQVRNIAQITKAVADGDLSKKITVDAQGEILELKDTINTMVDQLSAFASEVTRVAREVGTEGRLGGQAQVRGASGLWKDLTDNVNSMANNLTNQVRNIAQVATAVAGGDLTKKITVDARGEIFQLKTTINTMVDTLSAFADEVTRVAREVGTEGELGGQAQVRGASGMWKDLTDNVNAMANNLTYQVRNIAQVTTAVANGDLTKKIDVDAQGEILELKTTINTMVDTLSAFSSEVTRVAREVGSRGELGGQAQVPGASGVWKDLTDNVNLLASNLTTQVRAIAEVASAVARGDLTRAISVDAQGEVAELSDNVNLMVANLRETTRAKDWLESNLARIAGLMQGHRDLVEVASLLLSELTPLVAAHYGAFFLAQRGDGDRDPGLRLIAGYGYRGGSRLNEEIGFGVGLVGQAAVERKRLIILDAPPEYIKISSGLGEASPACVVVLPIVFEDAVLGVIELAAFSPFSDVHLAFFDQFVHTIGVAINTIIANARTEALLAESQRLTRELQERSAELQRQQEELRRSNAELEEKAALLAQQNREIEVQNTEIEQARRALEERAEQLALSSRYKSNFLANMSHELRTPLNSLLLLAKLLWANPDGNLTPEQVRFARTIYGAGHDLLQLIDDILDLSKIEAGKMEIHPEDIPLAKLVDYVNVTFRHIAIEQGLDFDVEVAPEVPETLCTDEQRLQQIVRNLLSNALKFTGQGSVRLRVGLAENVVFATDTLRSSERVISFGVTDTGVGIPYEKLTVIFDAFQQADGTTSRKYGGTGLGLSICREIAELLGGEIKAVSDPGRGSTFSLYLPERSPYRPRPDDMLDPLADVPADPVLTGGSVLAALPAPASAPGIETLTPVADPRPRIGTPEPTEPGPVVARDAAFAGRKVLIVDDDIRNVFALSTVLERSGLKVCYAADGRRGIEALEHEDDICLVFMDVMMPEMDGYATTRAIRAMPRFADLPIVALTAKAMKGDQEKSLVAGMSDYVTKPVEIEHLFMVMRRWLEPPAVPPPAPDGDANADAGAEADVSAEVAAIFDTDAVADGGPSTTPGGPTDGR
ncbi:HAMP domain-containing protein [Actinomadura rupiterrae]|uniref:HAMP domain-containing protein n=1 Tax=Actinomadura rupiterrae TaxID=559627 RepID=UPI0020A5AFE4|nr:HAMP domain-containing protein [Actinomadura rupiterrae]MCP2340621.1 HAMP domain-containing protein/signal transduction histidine kinase/ActR/RegA family two-component response regulator [Actinomadura rupiterrae]